MIILGIVNSKYFLGIENIYLKILKKYDYERLL